MVAGALLDQYGFVGTIDKPIILAVNWQPDMRGALFAAPFETRKTLDGKPALEGVTYGPISLELNYNYTTGARINTSVTGGSDVGSGSGSGGAGSGSGIDLGEEGDPGSGSGSGGAGSGSGLGEIGDPGSGSSPE